MTFLLASPVARLSCPSHCRLIPTLSPQARAFWEATDNTMGINHGIGSAADPGFLALETRAGYTAYFEANDTREADANVNGTHYGFPMVRRPPSVELLVPTCSRVVRCMYVCMRPGRV